MSQLRRLALGLSVLVLLAGVATAAYAAGQQHSPTPPTPTDTTAPPTTPPTTQPAPEAARAPAPTTTRPATTGPIKLVVGKYCAAMHAAPAKTQSPRRAPREHFASSGVSAQIALPTGQLPHCLPLARLHDQCTRDACAYE